MSKLNLVAAQLNFTVGDIYENAKKIVTTAIHAYDLHKSDLVIFPELAISGYPPEDLLLRNECYIHVAKAIKYIQKTLPKDIAIIIGFPRQEGTAHYNSAALIKDGKIAAIYDKHLLPNYGVFDEKRYFTPGTKPCIFELKNIKIGLAICEDLWKQTPIAAAKAAGAQLIVSINASPFDMYKPFTREKVLSERATETHLPIVYINCIGGQDELVFDGGSMTLNNQGEVTQRADFLVETLMPIELKINKHIEPLVKKVLPISSFEERIYKALVLGIRDYIKKNQFKGVVIGLSGGIDSALTLALAVDALGKDKVEAVYMPSRYSSKLSTEIAEQCAKNLEIKLSVIPIEPIFNAFLAGLKAEFADFKSDVTEENLQARCRGTILMAISNKKKLIVLSTGNKSEMAVGYATLYGDMAGGFCALKDVPKTIVYKLAAYRNNIAPVIPQSVIHRAPSAELAPNQQDQDTLPPYEILDEILERYVEKDQSLKEIVAAGFDRETVAKVITMVNTNEYKRRQAPPGVRITARAFGRDRRYPITAKFDMKFTQ